MSKVLQKAVVDAANEVALWKMRAYLAEAKLEELEVSDDAECE